MISSLNLNLDLYDLYTIDQTQDIKQIFIQKSFAQKGFEKYTKLP